MHGVGMHPSAQALFFLLLYRKKSDCACKIVFIAPSEGVVR